MADARKTIKEAAKADSKVEKTDNKDAKENVSGAESANTQSGKFDSGSAQAAEAATTPQPTVYAPVDIRL